MDGIISSGDRLTSNAGIEIFRKGGNAFDACLASVFASFITEGILTSPAGGGMTIIKTKGKHKCVDMMANYPGLEKITKKDPVKTIVDFGGAKQYFYLCYPSITSGGSLQGLIHIYNKYCSMDLKEILKPAIRYGENGVKLGKLQEYLNYILRPMATHTKQAREIYKRNGKLIKEGEIIKNKKFAKFLEILGKDPEEGMEHYFEQALKSLKGKDCSLGKRDLEEYKVKESDALNFKYRGNDIYGCVPPSSGGILLGYSLKELEKSNIEELEHNGKEHLDLVAQAMKKADNQKTEEFFRNLLYKKEFGKSVLGSTTHVSVIDGEGNTMGITTSNGEGSGIIAGDTGIMFNNFLGEEDLIKHKEIYRPGHRMITMMAPAIISKKGKVKAVLGSGGSKRIWSAIMQAIVNYVDFGMNPQKSVEAARVYYDEWNVLQMEKGINEKVAKELSKKYKINLWKEKNLFFGGVHMATPSSGGGDPRRGGSVKII